MKNETKQENRVCCGMCFGRQGTTAGGGTYCMLMYNCPCHTEVKESKWKEDAKPNNSFSVKDQANIYPNPPISQREEKEHLYCTYEKDEDLCGKEVYKGEYCKKHTPPLEE